MNPKATPITNVNLKLLQTFVLVAEHGSFHKAAGETCRSQSAVSSQIRQLEQQLGFPALSPHDPERAADAGWRAAPLACDESAGGGEPRAAAHLRGR